MSDQRRYNPRQKQNPVDPVDPVEATDIKEALSKIDNKESQQNVIEKLKELVPEINPEDTEESVERIQNNKEFQEEVEIDVQKHSEHLENLKPDVFPSPPVYNVFRNEDGKAVLESKKKSETQEVVQLERKVVIQEMINAIKKDIMKTMIEIEICEVLDKELFHDRDKHQINLRRMQSFKDNIEHLNMKKDVLSKIIDKG